MVSDRPGMSRAARTARGAFGALATTVLAAASHGIAGGVVTPLAVVATTIFIMPLCIALAGRVGSLWRLALAVSAGQLLFHWWFAGLGLVAQSTSSGENLAVSPHAAHLAALASFSPELAAAGSADIWMWLSHAAAALLTVALLHRGEQAALRFLRVLRDTVTAAIPTIARLPLRPWAPTPLAAPLRRTKPTFFSAITLRGPPAAVSFA